MNPDHSHRPPEGIITPLITPFLPDGAVDQSALARISDRIVDSGVVGLLLLGTTGEGPCLSIEQRMEIIDTVTRRVGTSMTKFVAATDTVFNNSARLIRHAEQRGADAIVLTPPFYFTATQEETLEYFCALASTTRLPCYLYNIPALTHTAIEPRTVLAASKAANIVGIKDSSGDMMYFNALRELMSDQPDFSIYIGPEELLLEASCLGIKGGVNGGSNLFPQLYVSLFEAARREDWSRARALHSIVIDISQHLYGISRHQNACARVLKFALSSLGLCSETMASPYLGLTDRERSLVAQNLDRIRRRLAAIDLLSSEPVASSST